MLLFQVSRWWNLRIRHARQEKRNTNYPFASLFKGNIKPYSESWFSGPKDEVDLILSRAALFTQPANIHSMTICPLHREKLGLGWRRGSYARCRVPEVLSNHDKKGKKWPKCDPSDMLGKYLMEIKCFKSIFARKRNELL